MGIYATDERIVSVNVGSKDMIALVQDDHILALGTKYWAFKLSSITWYKYQRDAQPFIYSDSFPRNYQVNTKVYCSNQATLIDESGATTTRIYFPDYTNLDDVDLDVWLIYEFNQTLYAKVNLEELNWVRFTEVTHPFYYATNIDGKVNGKVYSLYYETTTNAIASSFGENAPNKSIAKRSADTSLIYIRHDEMNTLEKFEQFVKGKEVLYEVAE